MEGEQSEIVEGGCKLLRSGATEQAWNGVGIVLSKELKEDLISVSRKSYPVMSIELGLEDMVVNIITLHKWVVLRMKNERFGNMDQELKATQDHESVIV